MLRSAINRSTWIQSIGRASINGQQGAQQGQSSSWRGEDAVHQHNFTASHSSDRSNSSPQSSVIHTARAGAASLLSTAACTHTATRHFSSAAGMCQQARQFSSKDDKPADASKAAPAERHPPGGEDRNHALSAEEERRATAEQASTSSDSSSSDSGESNSSSSSRNAWTSSEEYQRMAAELKRVAGLNKLESAEKVDAENPLSFVVQAYRYLKGRAIVFLMKRVDPEFDEADFLEGAKDAYHIVTRLWSEQDFDAMRPMMSRVLLDALRGTTQDYADRNLTMRIEPASDIDASLESMNLMGQGRADWYGLPEEHESAGPSSSTPEGVGVVAPAAAPAPVAAAAVAGHPAAEATIPLVAGGDPLPMQELRKAGWSYVLLTVRFRTNEMSTIVNAGGAIVQQLKDRRQQLWRFCWGPLHGNDPKPVPDLPRPSWRLLDLQ